MKNIHILPTDKPSRLSILNSGKLNFGAEFINSSNSKAQNIYITSDEEIKVGDWFYNSFLNEISKMDVLDYSNFRKKIILTDNKDLIKDGVQAIDDEFLEWFVKNPSCERVEIKQVFVDGSTFGYTENLIYKIIIPKEEPKQETLEETLEETAEKYSEEYFNRDEIEMRCSKISFIDGYKLAQEQILDFLYEEITERRDYSASKMCEQIIEFIKNI
jgi:hypothetical protein